VLESISPTYQCFPITTPVVVRTDHQKVALEPWKASGGRASSRALTSTDPRERLGSRGRSPSRTGSSETILNALSYFGLNPRARGVGFDQARPCRWEPLLGAYDASGRDYRGALGALVVNVEPPFRGSVWAAFTPGDADFYRQPVVTNACAKSCRV